MNLSESLLAIELILEDIRGNWAWGLEERIDTVKELANEIISKNQGTRYVEDMKLLLKHISEFEEEMNTEWVDGRHFRTLYPEGYIGYVTHHKLEYYHSCKSPEFKQCVECLTYPEYRFEDWSH